MPTLLNPNMPVNGMLNQATPSHNLQPQGVTLNLDASVVPAVGFIPLEQLENDGVNRELQVALPNIINISNASDAKLTLNDGLLRTHLDAIHLSLSGGSAQLYILKKPVTHADELNQDTVATAVTLSGAGHYVLQRLNGLYVVQGGQVTPISLAAGTNTGTGTGTNTSTGANTGTTTGTNTGTPVSTNA